jgi:hypothetical protein
MADEADGNDERPRRAARRMNEADKKTSRSPNSSGEGTERAGRSGVDEIRELLESLRAAPPPAPPVVAEGLRELTCFLELRIAERLRRLTERAPMPPVASVEAVLSDKTLKSHSLRSHVSKSRTGCGESFLNVRSGGRNLTGAESKQFVRQKNRGS